MEDSRTLNSSQRLVSTFKNLLDIPEGDITGITVVRSGRIQTSISRDVPVLVQEMVFGRKEEGMRASSQILDKEKELLPSSEDVLGARKHTKASEILETHVLKGKGIKNKIFFEKLKHFIRGSEERVGPKEGQQTCGNCRSLHKKESNSKSAKTQASKPQRKTRRAGKGKMEWDIPSGTGPTLRDTELQQRKKQQWTMYSIRKEILWNSKTRRRK
ncbi:hypothetical protein O181_019267 [Austropuccinia psidii MF-1]|uniref:Uncharacterized protein n=1 Tax=Austropuccinia psidii MF-1 TaxID=1389203 RepID=A0A9Q3CB75_9BASI|nr:hypothetical protein [Austropuccinia psidii MF-1]